MTTLIVPLSSALGQWLRQSVCPAYRGRDSVRVRVQESVRVHDYWDGGGRTYAYFVDLQTRRVLSSDAILQEARQTMSNPFGLAMVTITLRPGVALVEHSIFCGKDVGLSLIVHPADASGNFLTAGLKMQS